MPMPTKEVLKTKEDREKHVNEFYAWLSDKENYQNAVKALKKNVTYDHEIFMDAFDDAVLATANSILEYGTYIDDFQNYFYIACKWKYIGLDNKKKNRWKKEDSDYLLNIWKDKDKKVMLCDYQQFYREICVDDYPEVLEREHKCERIRDLFKFIHERLEETFTPQEVDIFMLYYRLKSEGKGISYKNLAGIMGLPTNRINTTIVNVRHFIKEDEKIMDMKKRLIDDTESD